MSEEVRATVKRLAEIYGSYEALAREIGVSWVTVQRWISGRTQPSPLATRRIQELIGEEDTSDS